MLSFSQTSSVGSSSLKAASEGRLWGAAEEPRPFPARGDGRCVPLLGELLGNPHLRNVLWRIIFQDGTAKVILLELKLGLFLRGL